MDDGQISPHLLTVNDSLLLNHITGYHKSLLFAKGLSKVEWVNYTVIDRDPHGSSFFNFFPGNVGCWLISTGIAKTDHRL